MEHFEYLYLLHRAYEVWRAAALARAEGEAFHVSDAFTPLRTGLEAHALITEVPGVTGECLVLRLRHPDGPRDWTSEVCAAQGKFFEPGFVAVKPVVSEKGVVHLAYATKFSRPAQRP